MYNSLKFSNKRHREISSEYLIYSRSEDSVPIPSKATPHDKYNIFKDVTEWITNVGFPGYANAASIVFLGDDNAAGYIANQ